MVFTKILIIGGGKTTEELLKRLDLRKVQVTIVEKNIERRQEIISNFDVVVIGKDASDPSLYTTDIKINQYDAVIALTDNDEVNILSLAIASMYEVPHRIASVSDRKIAELIRFLEIGTPINKPSVITSMINNYLLTLRSSLVLTSFKIGDIEYYLHYVTIGENDAAKGQKISDVEKRAGDSLLKILLVFDGEFFRAPSPDDEISSGYQLIILSSIEDIDKIIKG